ncbi:MAG: hypothetical protein Q7Q71_00855 [Verrucomicrobiota bacterium JB023]|nr:hypothetical protein [Verrucomicrobiota bacterium JB023]
MNLPEEKITDFNERMNEWIAGQGLLFQLTHGGTGLGERPSIVAQMMRMLLTLLALVVVAALAYGGYLVWRVNGSGFAKELSAGIGEQLGAEDITARGFNRKGKKGTYYQVLAEGNEDTFYEHLEARRVEFKMSYFDGLFGEWDGQTLRVASLFAHLKSGGIDDEHARTAWQSLFSESDTFKFNRFEVGSANFSWGYNSPATWGSIIDASLLGTREDDGWRLILKGGKFSQGIFDHLDIVRLEARLHPEQGLSIEEAELEMNGGQIKWQASVVEGIANPRFEGSGTLTEVPINRFLPLALRDRFDGTVSGTMTLGGYSNSSQGIHYELELSPGAKGIGLTHEIPLLRLLTALDKENTYRKVVFNEGGFLVSTEGEGLTISEIDLKVVNQETELVLNELKGSLQSRPGRLDEINLNETVLQQADQAGLTAASINDSSNEFVADSVRLIYANHQPETPPTRLELKAETVDENGVTQEVDFPFLEPRARDFLRTPHILSGDLTFSLLSNAMDEFGSLPQLKAVEGSPEKKVISLSLSEMDFQATTTLSEKWESALQTRSRR